MARRLAAFLIVVSLVAFAGCDSGGDDPPASGKSSAAAVTKRADRELRGAPAPLASLHRQSSKLLKGGVPAFRARMSKLRGYPVVVNKWGSWCAPCRAEFPHFQNQSIKRGKKVAFLGVDGQDPGDGATKFLSQYPVSYPSYEDFDLKISSQELKAVAAFPSTVFYDKRGEMTHVKQGLYETEGELAADIERYAR